MVIKIINKFNIILIVFVAIFSIFCFKAAPEYQTPLITDHKTFKKSVAESKDGDILFVGDIDFTYESPNTLKSIMEIEINKNIQIVSGLDRPAVFTNGMLLFNGSKVGTLKATVSNIIFDGCVDGSKLTWDDRLWPYDVLNEQYYFEQPTKASHAISFAGNVEAKFNSCIFKNYFHEFGSVLEVRYGDYTSGGVNKYQDYSNCNLSLGFYDCDVMNNSSVYYGGAFYIESNNNVSLNMERCLIDSNQNSGYSHGGSMYIERSNVNLKDCIIKNNTSNKVYPGQLETIKPETQDMSRGGSAYFSYCNVKMRNCEFLNNTGSMGGAIAFYDCSAELDGCRLHHNRAEGRLTKIDCLNLGPMCNMGQGGAIYIEGISNKTVSLINCEVYSNSAEVAYSGIYSYQSLFPDFGVCYLKMTLCSYANNHCDSSYDYSSVDPSYLWFAVPGDLWDSNYIELQGCIFIDDDFDVNFSKDILPSKENKYNYLSSPNKSKNRNVELNEDIDKELINVPNDESFLIPEDDFNLLIGNRYANKKLKGIIGSNYNPTLYSLHNDSNPDVESKSNNKVIDKKLVILIIVLSVCAVGSASYFIITKTKKNKPISTKEENFELPPTQIIITRYSEEELNQLLKAIPEVNQMTDREIDVFKQMLAGKKQGEIASILFISTSTVKDYYKKIYHKLNVPNKEALIKKVYEYQLSMNNNDL